MELTVLRETFPELRLSVNLSVRDLLDPELPTDVELLLLQHGLDAGALELEVTETSAMQEPQRSLAVLNELQALGVRLAIDDYGTGYSSLAYLRSLPVDVIKIDRSFVMSLSEDPSNEAIVRSTVDLGRNLGLSVVAEGVEDEAACRLLRDVGCDEAQGYWLARPLPPAEVAAAITSLEARLADDTTPADAQAATA